MNSFIQLFSKKVILLTFLSLVLNASSQSFLDFTTCLSRHGFQRNDIVARGNSKEYTDLNYQFRLNAPHRTPLAYVLPSGQKDVVASVTCARQNNLRVVAKSGGHQYEKYAYGDNTSVVIDLRRMNNVTVNGNRATIGSGSLLGPTNWKLWTSGQVFFPTGLCPMVGIGGLAPGGGHGYFTRNYGLTLDYIEEMNIVIANGTVLTVNNRVNTDLFWALRGGGAASFGIITRFILKLLKTPEQIFEGVLFYDVNDFPQVFHAWQIFHVVAPRRVTPNFRIRNKLLELHFFDASGTSEIFEHIEARFPKAKNQTTSTYTFPEFLFYTATNFGGSLKPGIVLRQPSDLGNLKHGSSRQEHIKTKSFFVPKLLNQTEISQLASLFREQPAAVRCRFEGYGGAVNNVRPNDTAFIHRSQRFYNARATVDYQLIKDTAENRTANLWLNRFFNFGLQVFGSTETYQNYPDADMPNYLQRYYGQNLPRLIRIKRKYDPTNYFRNPQSIPRY